MVSLISNKYGPGRHAPARLFWVAFAAACLSSPLAAQAPARPAAPAPTASAPDTLVVLKLVWSSLIALDQANRTGNYSVLRDLGAPSFQANNSAATLAGIFQVLRAQQADLANTLLVAPTLDFPPTVIQGGLLRVRGSFPLRPTAVGFDLLFQNVDGQWRLFGISVVPLAPQPAQTGSTRR